MELRGVRIGLVAAEEPSDADARSALRPLAPLPPGAGASGRQSHGAAEFAAVDNLIDWNTVVPRIAARLRRDG